MLSPEMALLALDSAFPPPPLFQGPLHLFDDPASALRPPLCLPAVSCSLNRVPNLDGCCINHPSGHFLATQFWDTQPAVGANDTWTIHGLWPDYCTGGFDAFCNSTRALSGAHIRDIIAAADAAGTHPGLLDFMDQHWQSMDYEASHLWSHEWNKHGTCISTIEPSCYDRDYQRPNPPTRIESIDVLDYFTHASLLFSTLPTFQFFADHGIVPSYEKTYTLEQLHNAIRASPHAKEATIHCRNHNELSEIWYHFNARGNLRNAMDAWWNGNKMWSSWIPTTPDGQKCRCPDEGIRYLPKGSGKSEPPSTTSAPASTISTQVPTGTPFVDRGRLLVKVVSDSSSDVPTDADPLPHMAGTDTKSQESTLAAPIPKPYTGCLIRHGTWFNAHSLTSCAIFNADDDVKLSTDSDPEDDTDYHLFTLSSRYAPCSFVPTSRRSNSYFTCNPDLSFQSILSNNATADQQHTDDARRLSIGPTRQSVFYASSVPRKYLKETLWTGLDDEADPGTEGSNHNHPPTKGKNVEVEIYWVGVDG